MHLVDAAKLGAQVATIPPSVIRQLYKHPLTERGLEIFVDDWAKTGQTILGAAEVQPLRKPA
jgi:transaldolase